MLYNGSISKSEPCIYSQQTGQIKIINNITIYLHSGKLMRQRETLKLLICFLLVKKKKKKI